MGWKVNTSFDMHEAGVRHSNCLVAPTLKTGATIARLPAPRSPVHADLFFLVSSFVLGSLPLPRGLFCVGLHRYLQFTAVMFLMLLVIESVAQVVGVLIKVFWKGEGQAFAAQTSVGVGGSRVQCAGGTESYDETSST